jgi:hypothetical protein
MTQMRDAVIARSGDARLFLTPGVLSLAGHSTHYVQESQHDDKTD